MHFEAVQGDIAAQEADALVNAANTGLRMGSGAAGALRRAAGGELNDEAVAKGPAQLGGAGDAGEVAVLFPPPFADGLDGGDAPVAVGVDDRVDGLAREFAGRLEGLFPRLDCVHTGRSGADGKTGSVGTGGEERGRNRPVSRPDAGPGGRRPNDHPHL